MKIARLILLGGAIAALAACHARSEGEVREPGQTVERDVAIGAFQRIAVAGPFDVEVKADGAPGLHVSGGANLIDASEFKVENGTLRIGTRHKNIRWTWNDDKQKVRVVVTGGGAIDGAAIAGSGDVRVERVRSASFKGEVAGSGDLAIASLETGKANFAVAGSGDISAAGKAESVDLSIAGSGDIDVGGLEARDADVSIAGSGNIRARATGTADVSIMGSGNVDISGGAKCDISKAGSGEVHCS